MSWTAIFGGAQADQFRFVLTSQFNDPGHSAASFQSAVCAPGGNDRRAFLKHVAHVPLPKRLIAERSIRSKISGARGSEGKKIDHSNAAGALSPGKPDASPDRWVIIICVGSARVQHDKAE